MSEPWFVYIIKCKDSELYTGIAKDVEKRVKLHNQGLACRFTKYRHPVKLLFVERHPGQDSARKRELAIKGLTREKKFAIINKDPSPR